jgi:hypothetical protein
MLDHNLDTSLDVLRQSFADVGTLLAVVVELRQDVDKLLGPLAVELRRVRAVIDEVLGILPS